MSKLNTPVKTEIPLPDFPLDNVKSNARASSPPPYAPSDPSSSSSVSTFIVPSIQPSNYISLNEVKHSARGTFVLDPSLAIPSECLPPLPEGDSENNRSNLNVRSQNGHTSAEVFLLNRPITEPRKKVILNTTSLKGSVWNIIHREGSSPPFHLTSSSRNGNVSVKLPRSFRGSVIGSTRNGRVQMSDAVSAQAVVLSTVAGTQRTYIGDLRLRKDETDDMIVLESQKGSITIHYEDEMSKGFFSNLFG